jgi:hypothetical protein
MAAATYAGNFTEALVAGSRDEVPDGLAAPTLDANRKLAKIAPRKHLHRRR